MRAHAVLRFARTDQARGMWRVRIQPHAEEQRERGMRMWFHAEAQRTQRGRGMRMQPHAEARRKWRMRMRSHAEAQRTQRRSGMRMQSEAEARGMQSKAVRVAGFPSAFSAPLRDMCFSPSCLFVRSSRERQRIPLHLVEHRTQSICAVRAQVLAQSDAVDEFRGSAEDLVRCAVVVRAYQ